MHRSILNAAAATAVAACLVTTTSAQPPRVERGNLVLEGIPEIPVEVAERMRQYQNTRSASVADWDPAGTGLFITTRFGETAQVHVIDQPGGARRQVTFFDEPVTSAAVCPDADTRGFLFPKDKGGNEQYQIYSYDLATGRHRMLTDGRARHGGARWNRNGNGFAFTSTRRNGRDTDVYVAALDRGMYDWPATNATGFWEPVDFSPDDRHLLVRRYVSANESYLHTVDLQTAFRTPINPSTTRIDYGPATWSKDGRGIFIVSDEGTEFGHLRYYDRATERFTTLTGDLPWDVQALELSPDGNTLAFAANEHGISRLYLMDVPTRVYRAVPGVPEGRLTGLRFHPDGTRLAMTIDTARSPGDVYVYEVESDAFTRWTYSEVGGLDTETFVEPRLIQYPTFDEVDGARRLIPAFHYHPRDADGPVPALILIHGGPESQFVPRFSATIQYMVNELGVAVIAPNVRGSAGYGKSYLQLDNGFRREDSVKDIGALIDWIGRQPALDSSRVGVMGGSYGGYMTLASMTHYNDRLACGINVVGISNFVTFLENTKDYRRDLRRVEYGDERNAFMRAHLEKISPTNNAHKITKPMMIAQGLNDPRVPASESEQILQAIRDNGGDAWYFLAKDEGHGFRKKANLDYYTNAVSMFLERYLVGR